MTAAPYDAIVLGAGAAGLMCAAVAGQRGRRVLLLDHADAIGKKILISGGGRCNFTNIHTAPDRYISANPISPNRRSPATPPPISWRWSKHMASRGTKKTLGQLFCDGSAKQIVAMLMEEAAKGGVTILHGQPVREVAHGAEGFAVTFGERRFTAPALVVATGVRRFRRWARQASPTTSRGASA